MLSQALGRLLAIVEAYPDLKANQNFLALQNELTATEDRIASARRYYNATVRDLNTKVETVPSNVIAGIFNIDRAEYFEAVGEQREAPRVDFGQRDAVIPPPSSYAAGSPAAAARTGRCRTPGHPRPRGAARRPRRDTGIPQGPGATTASHRLTRRLVAREVRSTRSADVHRSVDVRSTARASRARRRGSTLERMADAITIRGLTKAYGGRNAVDGLDLDIHAGECFALLGPNGAGKTTTVEIAEGFRPRDAGEVSILGTDPQGAGLEWRNRVGIVLQSTGGLDLLTPREALASTAKALLAPARRRRRARLGRPRRQGRHPHRRPERRPAAPARRGARHRRPPGAALPRRAHHRLRPAGPPRLLGAHPRAGRRGHDDPAHHPLPRRGREPRRPGRGHRRRPAAGRRHPRGARRAQRGGGHGRLGGGRHPAQPHDVHADRRGRAPRGPDAGRRGPRPHRHPALARGHLPRHDRPPRRPRRPHDAHDPTEVPA